MVLTFFLKNVQFWSDLYCIYNKYVKFFKIILYPKVAILEFCIYELTETILQSENIRKLEEVAIENTSLRQVSL